MCCKGLPLNFDRLMFVSVGYLIHWTGYMTGLGLTSKVMRDTEFGNLGFYMLAAQFLGFTVGGVFSAPVVVKCGDKMTFWAGLFTHFIFLCTFSLPLLRS